MAHDGLVLRQDEGHVGEVGQQNGGIVHADIFLVANHVLDDLGDDLQGEEGVVELWDLVVALEVCGDLLDDLADVRGQVADDLGLKPWYLDIGSD